MPFTEPTMDSDRSLVLDVRQLSHRFRDPSGLEQQVIEAVSFSVRAGELLAIVGPSGCGKTTLLTLIGGIRPIQAGSSRVCGIELFNANAQTLRQARARIGIVFQAHRLISFLTIQENIVAGLEAHHPQAGSGSRRRAQDLLRSVGLEGYGDHLPHQLSGGQRQRAGLARALAHGPSLLLADEPTASLDAATAGLLLNQLEHTCREQQMAIVMSTHDPRMMQRADRVLELRDGRLQEPTARIERG